MDNIINTSQLTQLKNGWVGELSDLGPGFGFRQIYPDACDIGLVLVSQRTGQPAAFYVAEEHRTRDNEISHYSLKPIPEAVHKFPALANLKIELFND